MSRKNIHFIQKPSVVLDDYDLKRQMTVVKTLHVDWDEAQEVLKFSVYSNDSSSPRPSVEGDWRQFDVPSKEMVLLFWHNLSETLEEIVQYGDPDESLWNEISLKISSIGHALFRELLPKSLADAINTWPDDCFLGISTNEQWIPWELMYDAVGFWGDRFKVARYPRRTNHSGLLERCHSISEEQDSTGSIINVVGGGIPTQFSDRAKELFGFASDKTTITTLKEQSVTALASMVESGDILHFTCHGHLEPHEILQVSSNQTSLSNLDIPTIKSFSARNIKLVFINACSSNVPVQGLSSFSSFSWEFYASGVEVCIGTLGTIPTEYALEFAEDFYSEFFSKYSDVDLMEAFTRAKRKAAKRQNFFWLLYSVYGNTDLRLRL